MNRIALVMDGSRRNPWRTLLTALSISLGFVLFGLLFGISAGFDYTLNWLSADSLRVMSKVSLRQPLPAAHVEKIERIDGVTEVQYAVLFGGYHQDPKRRVSFGAMSAERLKAMPHLIIAPEHQAAIERQRTGAIAGVKLAEHLGWKLGDTLQLHSSLMNKDSGPIWEFQLVGFWDMEGNRDLANELYVNYEYVNEGRVQDRDTVNIIVVRTASAEIAPRVAQSIDAMFANSSAETLTRSDREWVGSVIRQAGDVHLIVNMVLATAIFTLLILTRNAMAQSVRERTRDFGVMKVLGFSDGQLATLILAEAIAISVFAAIAGLLIAVSLFPSFARMVQINLSFVAPTVVPTGIALSVLLGMAASLPSAYRIARMQPADAIRAE